MKVINHHIHGHHEHDLAIYLAERMLVEAGHELKDGTAFANRARYPGLPDVYVKVFEQWHSGPKIIKNTKHYIIEIETNLNKVNELKKQNQFADPIIINLDDIEGSHDSINTLETHIRKHLPMVG